MMTAREQVDGAPRTEEVKRIFSTIAPEYDRFNQISSFGRDRAWRKRAVELAGLRRSSEVLDLAAGTGDLTLAIATQGRPASVLSTDFVPEMLEVAKEKVAAYAGPTRIEFDVADAQALQYADDSFDVAMIAFGVRNLPDRGANFREVHRVLKPGGRYVVLEFSRPMSPLVRPLYHWYLGTVIPLLGGLLTGDRKSFEYLNRSIRRFPGQSALAGELHKAGFEQVTWEDRTFGVVAIHVAVKAREVERVRASV